MPNYLSWNEKIISDFSDQNISNLYNKGYVFTRKEKGHVYQTRSLRINLEQFKPNSENRRILKKTEGLSLISLPLPYSDYHWAIGKLGKDFYTTKFGDGTFSANKIKELLTDPLKSNFNAILIYKIDKEKLGYCIILETNELLHYCYPFYELNSSVSNLGLGMMLKAILYAQEQGKKYIYLGSAQRPTDTYKLQFEGLEWFDGKEWKTDLEELKKLLKS
jgi:arginyl-tRNA--protein-N-Asp/Glu arginylyltransferase